MSRFLLLIASLLVSNHIFAQIIDGEWLVYEGSDGSELIVTLSPDGSGSGNLSLTRRFQAASYGEGSQFWGTFHTTGGYYFYVKGTKSESISLSQTDSTINISRRGEPATRVTAWLDEAYSTRGLSENGGYKKQIVAQWKKDFPDNEDVKKYTLIMERFFADHFDDAFEVLLEGSYRLLDRTDSTVVLQNLSLELPPITWKRTVPMRDSQ